MKNNEAIVKYWRNFAYFFCLKPEIYLPLSDADGVEGFDWFSIGDDERTLSELCSYEETDDNESSNKFLVFLLFVLEFDDGTGGVENRSSKSTDWSLCDGRGGDFDGISRKRINGSWTCSCSCSCSFFDDDDDDGREDDDEEISSRSCSCSCSRSRSDIEGVDIDESIDDERLSRFGETR